MQERGFDQGLPQWCPGQPLRLPQALAAAAMNILSYLQDNIEFFERKLAKARAEQSVTQGMWAQCLRAAQVRLAEFEGEKT